MKNPNKKILYLDQFFFSKIQKEEERCIKPYKKICSLIDQGLLACPYSEVHAQETRLLSSDNQEARWNLITNTAKNQLFFTTEEILFKQIERAFEAFLNKSPIEYNINRNDAIYPRSGRNQNYLSAYDAGEIRSKKIESGQELRRLCPIWSGKEGTFDEEYADELKVYAQMISKVCEETIESSLKIYSSYDPESSNSENFLDLFRKPPILKILRQCNLEELPLEERKAKFFNFLQSPHFRSIPIVDIDCKLFALLRKKIRMGQYRKFYKNKDCEHTDEIYDFNKKFGGLLYDIQIVSSFSPYVDAIFVDNDMREWILDKKCNFENRFSFRSFSMNTIHDFNHWLNEIENQQ